MFLGEPASGCQRGRLTIKMISTRTGKGKADLLELPAPGDPRSLLDTDEFAPGQDTRKIDTDYLIDFVGVPYRIRTGVAAVRGRCPRPLDEGDEARRIK